MERKHYPVKATRETYRCIVCRFQSDRILAAFAHARLIHNVRDTGRAVG